MPEFLTIILLLIVCIVVELAVVIYCLYFKVKLGFFFGLALLSQVGLPVAVIIFLEIWDIIDPPTYGVEPFAGEAVSRQFDALGLLFWAIVLPILISGISGICRIVCHRLSRPIDA
jgi:hypothetical protein